MSVEFELNELKSVWVKRFDVKLVDLEIASWKKKKSLKEKLKSWWKKKKAKAEINWMTSWQLESEV